MYVAPSFQGKNINEEAARVLQEGLDECALWGDLDIQALLLVEGARLEARRGKTDNSMTMLQVHITHKDKHIFFILFCNKSNMLKKVLTEQETRACGVHV